jgi:ATP-dependent RNA helicase DDX52/ROK1
MDLFKLLTRSTNLSKQTSAAKSSKSHVLPSSGENPNPQLFGNNNESKESVVPKKRKRNDGNGIDEDIPAEINFFHPNPKSSPSEIKQSSSHQIVVEQLEAVEDELLDIDDCKRILRSHKVKISVLSQGSIAEKKRSKRKKTKEELPKDKPKSPLVYIKPLSSFAQLSTRYGLRRKLLENIDVQGYSMPTEVQLSALPILMGEPLLTGSEEADSSNINQAPIDLLAMAPTGSGKTLAFLIPVLNSLLLKRGQRPERRDGPYALVVVPTKELANQIVNEGRKLTIGTGLRVTLIKKGMRVGTNDEGLPEHTSTDEDSDSQSESDAGKAKRTTSQTTLVKSDVIVATPLSLLHALERGSRENARLTSIEHLVLDEADVLLDPLFQEQMLSIWKSCSSPDLRTSLWSATMSSSIENLALATIREQRTTSSTIVRLVIGLKDAALPTVSHKLVYAATEAGKLLALRQLLRPTAPSSADLPSSQSSTTLATELRPPFLIFTQTIPRAIALHAELRYDIPPEAGGSSRLAVLHAGMSSTARSRIMASFRRGEVWVIVTTDLLARGVDFRGLNGVVNYDVPGSAAAYVHRAGRTGRAGRRGGVVVTLYTKEDVPIVKPIANVISASERMASGDGTGGGQGSVQQWLLDALPTPSKKVKKELKNKGLDVRRPGFKGALISTKLPDERRKMRFKKSRMSSKREQATAEASEFEGFDD